MQNNNKKFKDITVIDLNGNENTALMPNYTNGNELLRDLEEQYGIELETEDYETFYEKENISVFDKSNQNNISYEDDNKQMQINTYKVESKLDNIINSIEDNEKTKIEIMNLHTEYFKNMYEIMDKSNINDLKQEINIINTTLEDMVDDKGRVIIKKDKSILNLIFNILNLLILIALLIFFILGI